jgi:hypothetical protein
LSLKSVIFGGVMGAVVVMGGVSFAASSPTAAPVTNQTTPDPATNGCLPPGHDDAWPAWVQGRPDGFDAGDIGGVYLWHDNDGWHLRVTHATDDKAVISGVIHTPGRLVDVHGVALEKADQLTLGPDEHTMAFRFTNYGHIDGIDFRTACAPVLRFAFDRSGHLLPADRVFVGDDKNHPGNPFRVFRTA